jgi:hypothetical protein
MSSSSLRIASDDNRPKPPPARVSLHLSGVAAGAGTLADHQLTGPSCGGAGDDTAKARDRTARFEELLRAIGGSPRELVVGEVAPGRAHRGRISPVTPQLDTDLRSLMVVGQTCSDARTSDQGGTW